MDKSSIRRGVSAIRQFLDWVNQAKKSARKSKRDGGDSASNRAGTNTGGSVRYSTVPGFSAVVPAQKVCLSDAPMQPATAHQLCSFPSLPILKVSSYIPVP